MLTFFEPTKFALNTIDSDTPNCGDCGLFRKCHTPKLPVYGKGQKKILIVSESPSKETDYSADGDASLGKSSEYLKEALRAANIVLSEDCWLTSSLRCRPENNWIAKSEWIDYCRPNLINTIKELQPQVIIPLGGYACKSVLSYARSTNEKADILRWTGWHIPSQKLNAWICPTFHPSYVDREAESRKTFLPELFKDQLRRACSRTTRPWKVVPDYRKEVKIVYDPEEINVYLRRFNRPGTSVAIDYETNMLKPQDAKAKFVSASACWEGKETISFPWSSQIEAAWITLLTNPQVGKIASNAAFEHSWTEVQLGVLIQNWTHDTMLTAHVLDQREGITSIKFLSFVYLGIEEYDSHIHPYLVGEGSYAENRIRQVPLHDLLTYGGLDSLLEFKVSQIQKGKVG